MATFHIAAARQGNNPVRVFVWNGSIRAGEDLKVAFRMLDTDDETPVPLADPLGVLSLYPIDRHVSPWSDYGFGWLTRTSFPVVQADSFVPDIPNNVGRLNFFVPGSSTSELGGQYGIVLEVDEANGVSVQLEGVLQVRHGTSPESTGRLYFQPGITPIGKGMIPATVIDNAPADADGFPVAVQQLFVPAVDQSTTSVLGVAVLGQMILGD